MNTKTTPFITVNPHRCIGCWVCIDSCPKQVIGKVKFLWHKHVVFKNSKACIGCKKCVNACPKGCYSVKC